MPLDGSTPAPAAAAERWAAGPRSGDLREDRRRSELFAGLTCAAVLAAFTATALAAASSARGLYQDGAYYLLKVAEARAFYLHDPARETVQVLRQAPIVLASRLLDLSLFERAQLFTATMLLLPVAAVVACAAAAPRGARWWTLFPAVSLVAGLGATSFEAVGEAATAAGAFWLLLFLILFRTRSAPSRVAFLALCWPAAHLHEAGVLCVPALMLAALVRWRREGDARSRLFLALCLAAFVAVAVYQIGWIVHPRIAADRDNALRAVFQLEFLVFEGHLNMPAVVSAGGLTALGLILGTAGRGGGRAAAAARVGVAFAVLVALAVGLGASDDRYFSPAAQAQARYAPIAVTTVLGIIVAWLARPGRAMPARIGAPIVAVVATFALGQAVLDAAATRRWESYVAGFRARLHGASGLIGAEPSAAEDGEVARRWHLMAAGWTLPILSIVLAENGRVAAIVDYPAGTPFRPFEPADVTTLPLLQGVEYAPYRRALAAVSAPP